MRENPSEGAEAPWERIIAAGRWSGPPAGSTGWSVAAAAR